MSVLTIAAAVSTALGTIYQGINYFEDKKEYEIDKEVIAKGEKLMSEYDMLTDRYDNKEITNSEYSAELKSLIPLYEEHLNEIDNHRWSKDGATDAIYHRRLIELYLDSIHEKLEISSKYHNS